MPVASAPTTAPTETSASKRLRTITPPKSTPDGIPQHVDTPLACLLNGAGDANPLRALESSRGSGARESRCEGVVKDLVGDPGLEPGWVTPHAPQTCASTSSASRPAKPIDSTERHPRAPSREASGKTLR